MLYDKQFLLKLDKAKNKIVYARITALTFDESPIESITGRVTQGSINLDGASAVRRTCSLTLVAQDFNYNDYYWGLNTKFKLEIGLQNNINKRYPDIIYFDQGIYLISTLNTAHSSNNFTITIQGKDKICMMNGEVGGTFESSIDFGTIEEENENGDWVIRKIPIYDIIRNMVHQYGNEPYHNIIINDLDTLGLELLEYRFDTPLYLYRSIGNNMYENAMLENDNYIVWIKEYDTFKEIKLKDLPYTHLETLVQTLTENREPEYVYLRFRNNIEISDRIEDEKIEILDGYYYVPYYFTKITYGQTVGYRTTELVYAGDLIANIGETITSVLDKIKNMLGEFEYFYDTKGRFVFQKKKSFVNTLWHPLSAEEDQIYVENLALASEPVYDFVNGELITSFNNSPNLLNLKNDFSIWGQRTSVSGAAIPVHIRYAIDQKPESYTTIYVANDDPAILAYNQKYGTQLKGQETQITYKPADNYEETIENGKKVIYCDWREIIYQMGLDYFRYNHLDDFELRIIQANKQQYPKGITGYENYYTDLQGFWRQLYYPTIEKEKAEQTELVEYYSENGEYANNLKYKIKELEREQDRLQSEYTSYEDLMMEYTNQIDETVRDSSIPDIEKEYSIKRIKEDRSIIQKKSEPIYLALQQINQELLLLDEELNKIPQLQENAIKKKEDIEREWDKYYLDRNSQYQYWNKDIYETPESLNFWFDFLDGDGFIQKFSVKNMGNRTKAINDTNVKSIYFRETPTVIFIDEPINEVDQLSGYRYIQIGNNDSMFSISAQGLSAKNKLDELIYQHSYCIETTTINIIPIYYLEPNVRVHIYDKKTNIDGEYIVSKMTIPLTYNGTMSLTATKVVDNII